MFQLTKTAEHRCSVGVHDPSSWFAFGEIKTGAIAGAKVACLMDIVIS